MAEYCNEYVERLEKEAQNMAAALELSIAYISPNRTMVEPMAETLKRNRDALDGFYRLRNDHQN